MTYKYIIKYRKAPNEAIRIEAWPQDKALALPNELHKPSFTIGKLKGTRTIMLWQTVNDLAKRYGTKTIRSTTKIELPPHDIPAIAIDPEPMPSIAGSIDHLGVRHCLIVR